MMTKKHKFRALLLAAILLFSISLCAAQENAGNIFTLAAADLRDGEIAELNRANWKYKAGDREEWAARDFDDLDWTRIESSRLTETDLKAIEWNGRGWFRLRVRVAEELVGQPVALRVRHWGASEIYLDGELRKRSGVIEADGDREYNPRGQFVTVVFDSTEPRVLAVRYSFSAWDSTSWRGSWLRRADVTPGITLSFQSNETATGNIVEAARQSRSDYVFIGLLAALAFVHLLLFAFYRSAPGNLFYSFFAAALAAVMWLFQAISNYHLDAFTMQLAIVAHEDLQSLGVLGLLAFLYVEFKGRVSWFFWLLLVVWSIAALLHLTQLARPYQFTPVMLIVTLADGLRIMWSALRAGQTGARIIAAGMGVFLVCVLVNITVGRDFIWIPEWLYDINVNLTLLCIPLVVSLYLARSFARTNQNLERQIVQVKEFSEREIQHERNEARLLVVEAENERRAKELEEARQLQLSMLPKKLPQIPNLEIAAYMKPASEVGGDYYDFHTSEDGTLTVAIGDATGHGLRAGSVVTATKSLFNAFAGEPDITDILRRSSRALKQMNLRGLFMALTILKIKDRKISIAAAGMPAAIVYRAATGAAEEIFIKAMPLGSVSNFAYRQQEIFLNENDCVLLMSDGFPEMFNPENETLGFEKAADILPEIAGGSAQEIVNRLVETGERWANGRPADDDVTFVVVKAAEILN